jgi:hypothetical protein
MGREMRSADHAGAPSDGAPAPRLYACVLAPSADSRQARVPYRTLRCALHPCSRTCLHTPARTPLCVAQTSEHLLPWLTHALNGEQWPLEPQSHTADATKLHPVSLDGSKSGGPRDLVAILILIHMTRQSPISVHNSTATVLTAIHLNHGQLTVACNRHSFCCRTRRCLPCGRTAIFYPPAWPRSNTKKWSSDC